MARAGLPGGRSFALVASLTALFAFTALEILPVAMSLTLFVPAAVLTWTRRERGFYAYGTATSFVWLVGQMLAIGAAPSFVTFSAVIFLCALISALWIPCFAPIDSKPIDPPASTGAPLVFWLLPTALLVGGLLLFPAPAGSLEMEVGGPIWPWLIGWTLAWTFWRQRTVQSLSFVFGLAVGAFLGIRSGLPFSPESIALGVAFTVSLRLTLDRFLNWSWLVALAPAWLWIWGTGDAAFSGIVAGATSLGVLVEAILPRAAPGSSGSQFTEARSALRKLEPYSRHYGSAKLRQDPVYATLLEDDLLHGSILDIGCGMSLVGALHESSAGSEYVGLDLDPDKLRHGAQLLAARGASHASVHAARFPDWSLSSAAGTDIYDRVLLIDMLHYSALDAQRRMLSAARQRLAAGGYVIVRDPIAGENAERAVQD
ncbi:MAG: hypothetical protein ACJAYU_004367, partial [Bradymonadia bacterium]